MCVACLQVLFFIEVSLNFGIHNHYQLYALPVDSGITLEGISF